MHNTVNQRLARKMDGRLQFIFTRNSYASDSRNKAQLSAVPMDEVYHFRRGQTLIP